MTWRRRSSTTRHPGAGRGAVSERLVQPGEFIQRKRRSRSSSQIHPLKLRTALQERYAGLIAQKLPVEFHVDSFPDEIFHGEIAHVSPAVDQATRTFVVEALVRQPGPAAEAGVLREGRADDQARLERPGGHRGRDRHARGRVVGLRHREGTDPPAAGHPRREAGQARRDRRRAEGRRDARGQRPEQPGHRDAGEDRTGRPGAGRGGAARAGTLRQRGDGSGQAGPGGAVDAASARQQEASSETRRCQRRPPGVRDHDDRGPDRPGRVLVPPARPGPHAEDRLPDGHRS